MPLYDLYDKKQPDTGKKDYWKTFPAFKKTLLHKAYIDCIKAYLEGNDTINSSQAGSKIIKQIEKSNPEFFNDVAQSQVGSLFGMTLWHYIAHDEQSWCFHSLPEKEESEVSGTYYFKK